MVFENITRWIANVYNSGAEGFLFNIGIAIIILLLGFVVGKIVGRAVTRLLHGMELNNILKSAGVKNPLEGTLGALVSYLIYFVAIILALNQLNVASLVLYIILITVVVIIVISFLLSVKDFLPNFFAGLFIYRHGAIKEGDLIQVNGTKGKILHISITETQVETDEGDMVFIPNSSLTKNKVIKLAKRKEHKEEGLQR